MGRVRDGFMFLGTVLAGGVLARVMDDVFAAGNAPKENSELSYERIRSVRLMASLTGFRLGSLSVLYETELAETPVLQGNLISILETSARITEELKEYEAISDATANEFIGRIQATRTNSDLLREALMSVRAIREESTQPEGDVNVSKEERDQGGSEEGQDRGGSEEGGSGSEVMGAVQE